MPTARIKLAQGILEPPAGEALVGEVDVEVTCTNDGGAGGSQLEWSLEDVPNESVLTTGLLATGASFAFTPDAPGGYMVMLRVIDSNGADAIDRRVFQVPENVDGDLIPPFSGNVASLNFGGQLKGWAKYVEAILRKVVGGAGGIGGAESLGGGEPVYTGQDGNTLQFASLVAGDGVTLTPGGGEISIAAGGGAAAPGSPGQVLFNEGGSIGATPMITVSADDVFIYADDNIDMVSETGDLFIGTNGGKTQIFSANQIQLDAGSAITYLASGGPGPGTAKRVQYSCMRTTLNDIEQMLVNLSAFITNIITYSTLTVVCEFNICSSVANGNLTFKALFTGSSGTWTKVDQVDLSDSALWVGTPLAGNVDIVVDGTDIKLNVTGIGGVTVCWFAKIDLFLSMVP